MKKIPTVFQRNYDTDRLVRDEVTPGCEWVLAGEGRATVKWDGSACLVRGGKLFKRHELRTGKTAPEGFEPCQEPDPITGDVPGWVPVGDSPSDKWHREAWLKYRDHLNDGTYELVGPKVNGGRDRIATLGHHLFRHGSLELKVVDEHTCAEVKHDDTGSPVFWCYAITFDDIRKFVEQIAHEGIVWHHWKDGRMAKIKRRDFGFRWPA